jgi:hypothetical protein
MKILCIALLVLFPSAAGAASLEQSYLAARDAQARKVAAAQKKMGADSNRVDKIQEQALAGLEKQLKQIIGMPELSVPGVKSAAKINIESLTENEQGFEMLDGLVYASEDYKTQVVVTTEGLLKAWMRRARKPNDSKKSHDPAKDPAKAIASEEFYTQAVSSDATLSKYAELPIKKPAAASAAYAMFAGWAQDVGPWEPDELVMSVIQGGKLYVVRIPASTKLGPFPACKVIWDKAESKANEAFKQKSKVLDGSKIQEEGAAAFRRCFAEQAPKEKGFADLVRQAQTIVDGLPAE